MEETKLYQIIFIDLEHNRKIDVMVDKSDIKGVDWKNVCEKPIHMLQEAIDVK